MTVTIRRRCPDGVKKALLERQRYRCLYCGVLFGSVLIRRARMLVTSPTWDHQVPFAFLGRSPVGNWRAACATCNTIKADLVFINLVAIRRYMRDKWTENNIDLAWSPQTSSEEDPKRWAVEFSKYLASQGRRDSPDEAGNVVIARKSGARIVLDPDDDEPVSPARPPQDSLEVSDWLVDRS